LYSDSFTLVVASLAGPSLVVASLADPSLVVEPLVVPSVREVVHYQP